MATAFPPRTCPACGTDNLPLAPSCVRCGTALGPAPTTPVVGGRTPSAVGLAVLVGAVAVALAGLGALALGTELLGSLGEPSDPRRSGVANRPVATGVAGSTPVPGASSGVASALPEPSAVPSAQPPTDPAPSPRPTPRTIRLPDVAAQVPGATRIRRYAIRGDEPIELARAMSRKGDDHCGTHAIACVKTALRIADVTPSVQADGSCTIAAVRFRTMYTVWLPRWTKPQRVRPELLAWWREVLDHVAWHEARHIAIHESRLPDLRERLVGAACDRGSAIAQRWHRRLRRAQDAFDQADSDWRYPRYDGPGGFSGETP
jgi:predicted secreted Zn-dependent protease